VISLPIFPLPLVLFPGTVELLHIFEPRYRQMVADCQAMGGRFGLLCCPSGTPEGAIAVGTVGTVSQIETAVRLADGRSNIAIRGIERFRFQGYTDATTPYLVGMAELCADHGMPADAGTLLRLGVLFGRAVTASRLLADDRGPAPELPSSEELRTFAMAQFLELPLSTRQELLAMMSAAERAERLVTSLEALLPSLEERAARHEKASSNGHGHL
jgi:Lon protease-like protein